ncbi:MAG: hypothetical protein IIA07_07185 [Proteobacteria bacterium]|nr:hypothetical protein [Pseudomonadota bacterium]
MYEKIAAELRADGAIVLTVPDDDIIDVESAFMDGATCSRIHSENPKLDEEQRDMALQASECLERLEEIFGLAMGNSRPPKTELRLVK